MFFYFSKLAWFVAQPRHWLALIFIVGLIAIWRGRWRIGVGLFVIGPGLYAAVGVTPLGDAMILPLEHRHPRNPALEKDPIAGIVVLGGGVPSAENVARGQVGLTEGGERMVEAVRLAKEHPEAKIVFSGGESALTPTGYTEADAARQIFTEMGVEPSRLVLEDHARNTYENAKFTANLVQPKPGERWLLVTTAYHMPRAVGCFRAVGFNAEPWPVGFRTSGWRDLFRTSSGPGEMRRRVSVAVREWLGLIVYRLMGRIDRLLP